MPLGRSIARAALLLAIVAASAALYFDRLDFAPPNIQIDEAIISINAHAIATTGRDLRGEFLPLYAQTAEHSWYQPFVIYLTSAALVVAPLTEWSVRAPAVLMALLAIALMFLVVARAMASTLFGAVAAALLALTPALFIHGRYGMDYHYPLPFILGWLYCLLRFDASRRLGWLAGAGAILGAGFYCYISSIVMMPIYLGFTMIWLFMRREPVRSFAAAAGGMLPLLLPFAVWVALHPEAYSATVDKYGLYDSQDLNPVQGLRSAFGFLSVGQRLSQYWNYYDPSLLFFGSGIKVQFSTGGVGVFLLPAAFFILGGIYAALRRRAEPFYLIMLLGFVTAPIAAVIPTEENAIFRALGMLPFGILLATAGVEQLWHFHAPRSLRLGLTVAGGFAVAIALGYAAWSLARLGDISSSTLPLLAGGAGMLVAGLIPRHAWTSRLIALALLALMPLQFAGFRTDYFTAYRERVSFWLGGNMRGVLEDVIARSPRDSGAAVVFTPLKSTSGALDWRNGYIDSYWRFYLVKHDRLDLLERTRTLDADALAALPPGSVIVSNVENTEIGALAAAGVVTRVAAINEIDGKPFFLVLRK